jgi:hypothetical protein
MWDVGCLMSDLRFRNFRFAIGIWDLDLGFGFGTAFLACCTYNYRSRSTPPRNDMAYKSATQRLLQIDTAAGFIKNLIHHSISQNMVEETNYQ